MTSEYGNGGTLGLVDDAPALNTVGAASPVVEIVLNSFIRGTAPRGLVFAKVINFKAPSNRGTP